MTGNAVKNEAVLDRRIAVRCGKCGRILMYKISQTSGLVEWKCSRCGEIRTIDLALRRKNLPAFII